MELVVALVFSAAMLFGADRLLLLLESRGHIRWRRSGRHDTAGQPSAELDSLLVAAPARVSATAGAAPARAGRS